MTDIKWWAYQHENGCIVVKRFIDQESICDAHLSVFVSRILSPFTAKDRSTAVEIANKYFQRIA